MLGRMKLMAAAATALMFFLPACSSPQGSGELAGAVVVPGKLTFSTSGNYAPFSMPDASGKVTGYDVDVCNEIAKRLGLTGDPVVVTFNQTIAGVEAGQYDMACTGVALTPARASSTSFYVTEPTGLGGTGVVVMASSPYQKLDDLKGKRHGEASGASQGGDVVKYLNGDVITTQYPGAAEQILALKAGRIDCFSVNSLVAAYYANQDKTMRALPPINPGKQVQVVTRKNDKLIKAVNEQIDKMWSDGTMETLQKKYFGEAQARPK